MISFFSSGSFINVLIFLNSTKICLLVWFSLSPAFYETFKWKFNVSLILDKLLPYFFKYHLNYICDILPSKLLLLGCIYLIIFFIPSSYLLECSSLSSSSLLIFISAKSISLSFSPILFFTSTIKFLS